jgi:HAD superfamily hydrolase (TIGR01509 family)
MAVDSIVFAFDIHKVLLKPNILQMIKLILLKFRFSSIYLLFHTSFWSHIYKDGAVPENIIDKLCEKFNDKGATKAFLVEVINSQSFNIHMIPLLKSLKKQGYPLYIASNVWESLLIGLRRKFPQFDMLFDGYYFPALNNYIEKPDPRFYQGLKRFLRERGQPINSIIFIDDKHKNIIAARQEGLIGLKFTSADDLKKKLRALCINF